LREFASLSKESPVRGLSVAKKGARQVHRDKPIPVRRKPALVRLPHFYAWQTAIGMPLWRVAEATELCETILHKAAKGLPLRKVSARLLAMALEVPLDLLMRIGPDHPEGREIAQARSVEVQQELAVRSAELAARQVAFARRSRSGPGRGRSNAWW
jgi:hypothetical protein